MRNGLPRAVVFDLDGLMFNTEQLYTEVGSELLRRRGCLFTSELKRRMMGRPSGVALQMMIDEHRLADSVATLQHETYEIFDELLQHRLEPMPGLVELLAALEGAGLPKAIATSSRRNWIEKTVGRYGYEERFQFILTSDDVTHGKPHPEVYLLAASRFRLEPSQMLVLEDSQFGCQAAIAAGAFAVAVPGEHCEGCDYTGASLVANSLADPQLYAALGLR